MKFADRMLGTCAFALSTIMSAILFATFAAWAYGALGAYERELIAAAAGASPSAVASAIMGNAPSTSPSNDPSGAARFEPIRVIGQGSHARESIDRVRGS